MDKLTFKIIFVPKEIHSIEKSVFISDIKNAVENCGAKVLSINYSQIKQSEDEDYPEIEELSILVNASVLHNYPLYKWERYREFCNRWKNQPIPLPCSYVVLYGNGAFTYPKNVHVRSNYSKLSFGVLPHNGLYNAYKRFRQDPESTVDFYHDTRNVIIRFDNYQLSFSYDNIRTVIVNISNCNEIFFDLFNPPLIFRQEEHPEILLRTVKRRKLNLKRVLTGDAVRDYLIYIDFLGRVMPEEIIVSLTDKDLLGRANVLSLTFSNAENVQKIIDGIHFYCSKKSVHYSCISTERKQKPLDPVLEHMHFGCAYLITAIFKRNFIVAAQSSDISNNLRELDTLSQQNPDCLEKALTAVLAALDSGKILNFWHAIKRQYDFYLTNKDEVNFQKYLVPSKCSMIRRITLTPTRQLLWPPDIMYGNRVLRNFDSEYSLRVSFREDNMSRISFNAMFADNEVLDSCIKNPMTNGIHIGSRHYEFLGWSNSQIRDHGVWMYAEDSQGRTVINIRAWMGDFSHIHNVSKYMARMGQCFSQTEDALSVPLDPENVRTEMDIEGGYDPENEKPYCFSDGVGRISTELANEVHQAIGHDKLCSAFQIRYGGYKGMLVIDPTLKDAQIVFRNNMKKFDSPQNTRLEIARTSAPVSLKLNRPFITLLNHLGVRHRTFLRLQEEVLKTLTDMLFVEEKAAEELTSKTPNDLYNFKELSLSGIHLTTEPFFKSLLLALHRHNIEKIKSKANVPIDPDFGRNMLGVLDETGLLRYGQVFVQYTTDISSGATTRKTTILEREVLVTKNPCMHPGDVRKFQAVNIPQLRHIVDCIVFPQRGHRPHPNEMAGSDLDGDEYAVLFFDDLIFHGPNREPADFPEVHSPDVDFVTVQHMIDFLQLYIKNDQVGMIANAHLAHADNNKEGPESEICLSIAKKFSVAVDFAKTGRTAKLDTFEIPQWTPDFMENNHKPGYYSEKALGKMYRVCKDFESENEETSITYHDIKVDPDLVYDGWEKYKEVAVKAKNKYNVLLRSVLRNYGIQHEAEAFSGAFTNLHCRFQERKDRNEIEKVIIGCIKQLKKSFRQELLEEFANAGDIKATEKKILQKASACYVVTYNDPEAKCLSFPWILSNYLHDIKVRKTFARQSPFSPSILLLDEKILECASKNLLPYYIETGIWNEYRILCDSQVVKYALRTLMLWAQNERIIEGPDHSEELMFASVFIRLFLHVAELFGYVTKAYNRKNQARKTFSSGDLCLEFLKFCSSFRFYNPDEIAGILPFKVFKYNLLAKRAIVSYHRFALTGKFINLYFDAKLQKELIHMKTIFIESKIFFPDVKLFRVRSFPIESSSLRAAREALIKYSKVEQLNLREIRQTRKVSVSARGSETAIKDLKSILRKKHVVLRELFKTGIMPQEGN